MSRFFIGHLKLFCKGLSLTDVMCFISKTILIAFMYDLPQSYIVMDIMDEYLQFDSCQNFQLSN